MAAVGLSSWKKAVPQMKLFTAGLSLSLLALVGCKKDPPPQPEPQKEPVVMASASASAKVAVPLPEENAPKEIPTLVPEDLVVDGVKAEGVYVLEDGTLVIHEKLRVGRIVGDKVEWLETQLPPGRVGFGGSRIMAVRGRWPDAIDLEYRTNHGRIPEPTYMAFTGKGISMTYAEGGGWGDIVGVARLGESTLIAGTDLNGTKFATIRGPGVIRGRKLFAEGGCKPEERGGYWKGNDQSPAIVPRGFGATPAGTVISVGSLCEKRNAALEVWAKDSKLSTIMDLGDKYKEMSLYGAQVLSGEGDEAWIRLDSSAVLRYIEGRIETLPTIPDGAGILFTSPNKKLYASNSWGIHRWDKDHWTQIARFAWEESSYGMYADDKEQFYKSFWGASKFRPGKSTVLTDDCSTPFVFLYVVSPDNKADFTFPTTRKALSSFAQVDDLTLVDFFQGSRRLGVSAKNKAQAEAVLEHIKKTMPKEKPRLMCYAPEKPRIIDIKGK
ncbi:MAG TPA: hypothetical protein PKA58_36710 [Polyangium sp.]|nr:hypothetical protein [Polyangium sp.]